MIKLNKVKYSIKEAGKDRLLLDLSDYVFNDNKLNVIAGPSGSGKTTLLYAIGGLLNIAPGSIFIDSTDIYAMKPSERDAFRLNNMSIVYQNYNLFDFMNVTDNVVMPLLLNKNKISKNTYNKIEYYYDKMNLGDIGKKSINTLSGGEQQRVAVIRSLICKPKIILCDEPTANLDSENTKIFMDTLRILKDKNKCAIIIASHDPQVIEYADSLTLLRDGKIIG